MHVASKINQEKKGGKVSIYTVNFNMTEFAFFGYGMGLGI